MLKVTFGIIVLNGDFVLEQCIKSLYPYAHQILISEGPVEYWQQQGVTTSSDRTNEILDNFPDPENKIKVVHGQFKEKTEQCNAYMQYLSPESEYIWNVDSDEFFKGEDILKMYRILEEEKYTSVSVKMTTFFGGFDRYLTGFEENAEIMRIRKVYPGSYWSNHRPPTVSHVYQGEKLPEKHLDFNTLAEKHGIRMYHYSYVFPRQVYQKALYYKAAVSTSNIPNYFENVYFPWVVGDDQQKANIENIYNGVHEWHPSIRGACRTKKFEGVHPVEIQKDLEKLKGIFQREIEEYKSGNFDW